MKKSLFLFLLLSQIILAQNISVLSNEKILDSGSNYFYPHLSPDGQKIAFTTQNFTGLYVMDIKTKKITQVSDKPGAGYEPAFSNDGNTVYFRTNEYEGIKKYSSLLSYNLENKNKIIIVQRKSDLLPPKIINGKLMYSVKGEILKKKISERNNDSQKGEILAFLENQKISLVKDGQKTVLAPLGNGNYIWPQLSPDKTKLMFTFAGHGTYISDLNGNILAELGYLNATKWLNNDWVVGMKDRDNGDIFTASDIFAVKADGQKTVQLTDTEDEIEIYPDCSKDGSKIVYHTVEGDIYLMTLKYK